MINAKTIPSITLAPMSGLPEGEWHWIQAKGASEAIRNYKAKYGHLPAAIVHFRYDSRNWYGKTNTKLQPGELPRVI